MRAPASLPSSFARWPWDWRAIARKRPGGSSGQRRSPALSLWFSICLCSDIHDLILAQIKRQIIVGDPLGGSSLKGSRQGMPFVECNLWRWCFAASGRGIQLIRNYATTPILLEATKPQPVVASKTSGYEIAE